MKVSTAALAVLLCTMALCDQVSSAPYGADTPTACCFSYGRPIPQKFIVSYFETSSLCSQPGVIFLTKRDRKVCANPRDTWVQERIAGLSGMPKRPRGSEEPTDLQGPCGQQGPVPWKHPFHLHSSPS